MALRIRHKEVEFGVGDLVKVYQRIKEGEKSRLGFFEGIVIKISGELKARLNSFTSSI